MNSIGSKVWIWVYGPFAEPDKVPNLLQLPEYRAKQLLKDHSYRAEVRPGDPAPSANLDGAVQRQVPRPGETLSSGSTVEIYIYGPYKQQLMVPNMIGLDSSSAFDSLSKRGFDVKIELGPIAQDPNDAHTVMKQEPSPGTVMEGPMPKVRIWAYQPKREEELQAFPEPSEEPMISSNELNGIIVACRSYFPRLPPKPDDDMK